MQEARGAACHGEGGRRLPAIDRRGQQIDVHGQDSVKRQIDRVPAFDLTHATYPYCTTEGSGSYSAPPARSGKAPWIALWEAAITPRSVISPVMSRAGVTSKA